MNHTFVYESIIQNAKSQNRSKKDGYYEKHHIIPRCLDGNNEKDNLVLLTAKEHYLCHKLLTFIYKGNRKITCAFNFMTIDRRGKHNISARDYEYAKNLMKENPPRSHYDVWVEKYGKEEADKRLSIKKEKIRNTVTGRIYSKERRDKSAQGHKGIKMTKESSDKKSVSMIGKNAGKTHTIETKLKMQENLASPEVQAKMRKPRSPQGKENMKKSEQTRENMRNAWKKRKEQHG